MRVDDHGLGQEETGFKIGIHKEGVGLVPFRYGNHFQIQGDGAEARLLIAPEGEHVRLLLRLAATMAEPFRVIYVLLADHEGDRAPGRYTLSRPLLLSEVTALISPYRDFFEGDARHHLMIESADEISRLKYDQHNVLYGWGDLASQASVLRGNGLREGTVDFPYPHTHHIRSSMDRFENELLGRLEWMQGPLTAEDEI